MRRIFVSHSSLLLAMYQNENGRVKSSERGFFIIDLSSLTVLRTISRTHAMSHKNLTVNGFTSGWNTLFFCLVKLIFRRQFRKNPQF